MEACPGLSRLISVFAFGVLLSLASVVRGEDVALSDFRAGYGAWQKTGTAFDAGPATGDMIKRLEIEHARDGAVASSEIEGDLRMGTLTSPEFKVVRKFIAFQIGGGDYERDTCINLLVAGKIVRSATGRNSDRLVAASWDVRPFLGQTAQIQIVDAASGNWGHVNVDQIIQTDEPAQLPVNKWPLYGEPLRPQFHFTARQWSMDRLNPGKKQEGWINDLNGLIYYDGEYHLFAQRWAKCWLHAVSPDLIHWTELEPAFWEERLDSGVQSGTCVIDYQNTSGLSPDKTNPPMVAFWSRWDNRSHGISYSLDHGRTWKNYEKNPILVKPERDPKVFWHEPTRRWVMVMYGEKQYHILTSPNLLTWKDEKTPIPDSYECPDLFPLPVDGNRREQKWVLIQGNGQYSIGEFDGTKFREESPERRPADVGSNFYATQSWHNTETGDGRRIQVAWMRDSEFRDMPFSQQISFPCELTLRRTADGLRLFREPIREIASLHDGEQKLENLTLKAGEERILAPHGELFHIKAEVRIPPGAKLTFLIRGMPVTLTASTLDSGHAPAAVQGKMKTIEILVDRASIEAFANDGEISSTRYAQFPADGIVVKAQGGTVEIPAMTIWSLKSAWKIPR